MRIAGVLVVMLLLCQGTLANERPSLIAVTSPEDHAVDGGAWRSTLERTDQPWACSAGGERLTCVEHTMLVDNQSPNTLECYAEFVYSPAHGDPVVDRNVPALVLPRSSREIRGRVTLSDTRAAVSRLDCRARAPYVRIQKTADCKYEMFGKELETYYPPAAAQQAIEGPVVVSFLLPDRNGEAQDVTVAESSLSQFLDAAAVRFISDQRFKNSCAGMRYDLRMRFELRDRYLGLAH
jgi:TonB family protein